MKKIALYFHYSILYRFCQALAVLAAFSMLFFTYSTPVNAASVDNFEFESFSADYYVSKNAEGAAKMHVREELVAIFPDYDQNHGIVRAIPFLNAGGKNVTAVSREALNLKVTRNGQPENIYDIEKEDGNYIFTIRSADSSVYVHGRQVYVLEYDFDNVVLNYDKDGHVTFDKDLAKTAELYWDTNGVGWKQRFGKLTARVHFDEGLLDSLTGDTSCYVGYKDEKNPDRCIVSELEDGFMFETGTLYAKQNLTFDISIKPGTFEIIPVYNPCLLIAAIVGGVCTVITVILAFMIISANKEKRDFYKGCPTPPQYLPPKNLTFTEIGELSIKPVASVNVAILINLAVQHKIELVKGEKKFGSYKWQINCKNLKNLKSEESIILRLLNGGELPAEGTSFEVKRQKYNASLAALERSLQPLAQKGLERHGFREPKERQSIGSGWKLIVVILSFFITMTASIVSINGLDSGGIIIGGNLAGAIIGLNVVASIVFMSIASDNSAKYATRSQKGLEEVVYLNGLQLYMKMAEADRLAVLQSVQGADTSPTSIVKFYEKLLPYAILFRLEKTWMNELSRYYDQLGQPDWYIGTGPFLFSDFHSFSSSAGSSISSGSGSSSSSGAGGGGGSGGGGGGGGGGGC